MVAEIPLRIPIGEADQGATEEFQFQGNFPFKPMWDMLSDAPESDHYLAGSVEVMLGWSQDEEGHTLSPPVPSGFVLFAICMFVITSICPSIGNTII
jgi:hypothetical protein